MRYGIGLDVGITSVGYSVVELGEGDSPIRIVRLGSRIFDLAENPKNGNSLAAPRREKRSMRRRLRRKRHRLERIRGLIVSSGILSKEALDVLYSQPVSDIYEVRVKALDELVSNDEFARILIHLAERRGFKSNRKSDAGDSGDNGKLLKAVSENDERCRQNGYRTIGEMFYKDAEFALEKRNKQDNYKCTVSRDAVEQEARMIFAAQRELGNHVATPETEEKYLSILLAQRSFADGPACGPYSGNQIEKMCGKCTFFPEELRAAKASYSFQVFSLWQEINHIRIRDNDGNISGLTDTQRQELFHLAHEKADITYATVRKVLNFPENTVFVGVKIGKDGIEAAEKKKKIKALYLYHEIRKVLNKLEKNYITKLNPEKLDCIGENLSRNYSDEEIIQALRAGGIEENAIRILLNVPNMPKRGHISIKACKLLIPFLECGLTYDKACAEAGLNFKADDKNSQFTLSAKDLEDEDITNPVVRRAVSQTIKVINAIIREQQRSPVYINIELAREMALSKKDRDEIAKAQAENAESNSKAMQELSEQLQEYYSVAPTGLDLVKFKLWKQQDGVCPYSQERIEIQHLLDPGYVDVDHIVPYSKSFDDRMANKVLVLSRENREKGNRLPLEYLTGKKREAFIIWVNAQQSIPTSKKSRLLMEHLSNEGEWKTRNLVDTQYTSAFLSKYLTTHLAFDDYENGRKKHVTCVNGAVTAIVRKRLGLSKIRANGDLHHAMDATVIACITDGMVQRITNYSKYHECWGAKDCVAVDETTGEVIGAIKDFPAPWEGFRTELEIRLSDDYEKMKKMLYDWDPANYRDVDIEALPPTFVSRMCNHKVSGSAHDDTARSARMWEEGIEITKTPLTKLKLKNGDIEGYYDANSDRLLYEALIARLKDFGGNGEKAFAEPFHKPKSDGTDGPIVKSVKLCKKASSAVSVYQGKAVADNTSMVRVDVYYVENDGYYFVPLYVNDTVTCELTQKAPTRVKDKNGTNIWVDMDESNFVFSLRKNDLIRVYSSKELVLDNNIKGSTLEEKRTESAENGIFLYFDGLDVSTATFAGITHDNAFRKRGMGKTLKRIEKYEVDVLGNIRKVEREKRQYFQK